MGTWKTDSTKVNFGMQFVDDLRNTQRKRHLHQQLLAAVGRVRARPPAIPTDRRCPRTCSCRSASRPGCRPTAVRQSAPRASVKLQPVRGAQLPGDSADQSPASAPSNGAGSRLHGRHARGTAEPGTGADVDRANYSPLVTARQDVKLGDIKLDHQCGGCAIRRRRRRSPASRRCSPRAVGGGRRSDGLRVQHRRETGRQINSSYHYFLPSLDLNLLITPEVKVRLDMSRTEDAPPNGQVHSEHDLQRARQRANRDGQ